MNSNNDNITKRIKEKYCEILESKQKDHDDTIKKFYRDIINGKVDEDADDSNIVQYHKSPITSIHVSNKREPKESDPTFKVAKIYGTETRKVTKHIVSSVQPLPKMCMWAPLQNNMRTDDETTLHHVPYLGDTVGTGFYEELLDYYDNRIFTARDADLTDDVLAELIDFLTSDAPNLSENNSKLRSQRRGNEIFNNVDQETAFKLISEAFPSKGDPENIKLRYNEYQTRKRKEPRIKETVPDIDGELTQAYSKEQALHTYKTLLCQQCKVFDCTIHSRYFDFVPRYFKNEDDCSIKEVCGPNCFLNIENICIDKYIKDKSKLDKQEKYPTLVYDEINTDNWSFADQTMFNAFISCYKEHYCRIARSMGMHITCAQVYRHCQNLGEEKIKELLKVEPTDKVERIKKKKKQAKNLKKKTLYYRVRNRKMDEKDRPHYKPCNHLGTSCKKANCDCVKKKMFCEKFCYCPPDCPERFPGCSCGKFCNTPLCPCFRAMRECDPDLCTKCGADELEVENIRCKNVSIQRGLRKHLLLGRSDVSGWGVFLNGTAEKDDFISEYCGEIITQEEAERRGKIYDEDRTSFLFNLNNEYVIDAKYKGNKIRFANHSINPNCKAKVMQVNGDHRIGIFASQKIHQDEEIFFDYSYGIAERLKFVSIERQSSKVSSS